MKTIMPHEPHEEPLSVDEPTISPSLTRLSARNPLDHLRLLWWALVMPQQLKRYQEQFGEAAVKQTGKWLVSTLIWLPFLYPTLALGLEMLPHSADVPSSTIYLWISGGLLIAWLLTGIFGDSENNWRVMLAMLVGNAVLLSVAESGGVTVLLGGVLQGVLSVVQLIGSVEGLAGRLAVFPIVLFVPFAAGLKMGLKIGPKGTLGGGLVVFVLMGVPALGLAEVVKESVKMGHPSRLGRVVFGLLVVAHVFLVWFSFLGGWWVFGY